MQRDPDGDITGFSYRSAVDIEYKGDANFTVPSGFGIEPFFPDGDAETEITMPAILEVGWTNRSVQDLTVSLDLQWIGWSSFDELNIDFENNTPAVGDSNNPRDWKNTLAIRLGAEYQTRQPGVTLRAGYAYDPTPVPDKTVDTLLPDSDRHDVSVGLGYKSGPFSLDLAYMAILFVDRDVDNSLPLNAAQSYNQKGTYEGFAHIIAIGLNYSF
jgi:long-chain fatty acid transport protein